MLEGLLGLRVGDKELVARPGDIAVVVPGTPHRFWNAGEDEARFLCEVRPALKFESLIETMFTLAAEGKTNRKGMPNPLRLAVIAKAHFDTVRLPFPTAGLQRAGGRSAAWQGARLPGDDGPATRRRHASALAADTDVRPGATARPGVRTRELLTAVSLKRESRSVESCGPPGSQDLTFERWRPHAP